MNPKDFERSHYSPAGPVHLNSVFPNKSRRPERDTVIGKNEILDLVIILNTTRSVNEFLQKIR